LRTRVETYQAEHAYRLLLKKWPEFERTTRENFGLLALSSELLGDVELRARAGALCHSIEQRFGVSCVVGAASGTMQNEPIVDRAVAALGRSLREKRGFVFYDEAHIAVPRLSYAEVARSTERLIAAFERVALGESMAFADDYVQTLLLWSNTRSAAVRHQLLVVLSQVTRTVQRRHVLSDEATDHLIDELCDRLERAGSTEQLIGEFKQALERLALFTANGSVATYCMNLERTLGYLKAHCTEPLRASRVARRAGLSLPTFSRVFKQATGTSFGRYLRGLRVARAEQLLKTTRLSGERIADLCGFKSHQNLIRSFKRITGHTPGEFRHRHARDDSGGNANKHEAQDAQLSAP
jgi:AraC-like DNA-binding protein